MKPSFWQRLDSLARGGLPLTCVVLLVLVGLMPTHIPGYAAVAPNLAMAGAYYWAVYRPDAVPAWVMFLLGLFADVLSGTPLGLTALMLLAVHGLVESQRRFLTGKSFLAVWCVFAIVALGAFGAGWAASVVFAEMRLDVRAASFQYLLTVAAYPFVAWLFTRAHLLLTRQV